MYSLRNPRVYDENIVRTVRFSNTYFQNSLHEWNLLDNEIKSSRSISEFKRKLLQIIKPVKNSLYNISDIDGIKYLTKLRLKFSALNEHKFRHRFDCLNPCCTCSEAVEDNEHFFVHCPRFEMMRRDLLGQLSDIPGIDITVMDSKSLCQLLLFGSTNLTVVENHIVLEATMAYIKATKRFS